MHAARLLPVSVLLLRQPVPVQQGTDPYHDAFGSFCLPSFELSALDTRSATPGTPKSELTAYPFDDTQQQQQQQQQSNASDTNEKAAELSPNHHVYLMTHHMSSAEPENREFCVISFPILTHVTVSADELDQILLSIYQGTIKYDGVIMTSQKAVHAWEHACLRVYRHLYTQRMMDLKKIHVLGDVPMYVVGPATANALRSINVPNACKPRVIHGEHAGNAEALAHSMVKDMQVSGGTPHRFLYLVGDKRTQALIDTLQTHDAPAILDELCVYETAKDPRFEENCALLVRDLPEHMSSASSSRRASSSSQRRKEKLIMTGFDTLEQDAGESFTLPTITKPASVRPDWIVFFSPSGGEYALPELVQQNWILPHSADNGSKIACIGQTTAKWVRQTLGFEPHAIAARPTPEGLRNAILDGVKRMAGS